MAQVDEKCLEKRLPENIIIYRDGVGAGDIQTVLDVELKGIKVKNRKKKRFHFFTIYIYLYHLKKNIQKLPL